jgi:SAM-dependent methyltransferase
MTQARRLSNADVGGSLNPHLAMYRHKQPTYQTEMLNSLLAVWQGAPRRVLDIGGGTGVVAQCIADLFPVGAVTAIDIVDRFCPGLSIETRTYDGEKIPFADDSFDSATLMNVLHHVPIDVRPGLLAEIHRTVAGPLYIKDHLQRHWLDRARLSALDFVGNIPFGGMVRADYLDDREWRSLAEGAGYRVADTVQARYRAGPFAILFPNRLEITMRWERL